MTTKIITMTSLLMIAIIFAVVAPLDANAEAAPSAPNSDYVYNINGAGATFPFPLIDLWRVEYNKQFDSVNLNYQSIGSGGGIKQHIQKTVNFAATDAPMTVKEQVLAPNTLHIPETMGGVVITYNIPEIPQSGIKLTGKILSEIFQGKVTMWNDPKIAEINPGMKLPDQSIVVVHRSDGSGTTFVFTDYLSRIDPDPGWAKTVGKGKTVPWPIGLAAAGNEGVAGIVRTTTYSIGYVELAYAYQTKMTYAYMQNGDKSGFVEPTIASISAATASIVDSLPAADGDWSAVSAVNAPGPDSYPISSLTYLILYKDLKQTSKNKEEAKVMLHMMHWMVTDGQKLAPGLQYAPLPAKIVELDKKGLSSVTYAGELLWKYDKPVKTGDTKTAMQKMDDAKKIADAKKADAKKADAKKIADAKKADAKKADAKKIADAKK